MYGRIKNKNLLRLTYIYQSTEGKCLLFDKISYLSKGSVHSNSSHVYFVCMFQINITILFKKDLYVFKIIFHPNIIWQYWRHQKTRTKSSLVYAHPKFIDLNLVNWTDSVYFHCNFNVPSCFTKLVDKYVKSSIMSETLLK